MKKSILFLGLLFTCSLLLAGFTEKKIPKKIKNEPRKSSRVKDSSTFLPPNLNERPLTRSMPHGDDASLNTVSKQHSNVSWGDDICLSPKGNQQHHREKPAVCSASFIQLSSSEISELLDNKYRMFNILKSIADSIQEKKIKGADPAKQLELVIHNMFFDHQNQNGGDEMFLEFEGKIKKEEACIARLVRHDLSKLDDALAKASEVVANFSVLMADANCCKEEDETDENFVIRKFHTIFYRAMEEGVIETVPSFVAIALVDERTVVIRRRKRSCCIIL